MVFRNWLMFLALTSACFAAEDIPQWVRDAAATPVPGYSAKVSAVVLLGEELVTVDPDGRRVMRERGAIRVLQTSGDKIEAYRTYNTRSGRIRDFQGWLIPPAGKPSTYPKNRVIDVALSPNWEEQRAKVLEAGSNLPGSVFAWEITEEERTVFTQYVYAFQGRLPVVASRFTLTVPAGWEVRDTLLNAPKLEPQMSGSTYTWEMRDLPWHEHEEHSPSLATLAPRLMISYFPSAENRAGLQGLKDWAAVSRWLSQLMDPSAEVTPAISSKAAQLIGNAADPLTKIRAIAAFVQSTSYVSIDINVTRGGGYTPHRAEDTMARNYGDCKDKATLMRALLKAVGIDSYPVVIYSADRTFVRSEWASPFQFNHAIIAVRVPDGVALPTVIPDTRAGRVLIFDPTDPVTPVGDLPKPEQGSFALLVADNVGGLITMPHLEAEKNRIESRVDATVDMSGGVEARLERQYFGQSGAALRYAQRSGESEIKKGLERALSRRLSGLSLKRVDTETKADNQLALTVDLTADHLGQFMQGRLFIVRPGLLTSGGDYFFTGHQRTAPIRLESDLRRESIRIKLPEGLHVDELPPAAKVESPYGTLHASWTMHDGSVVMDETLEIKETVAPAAEFAKVRDFFDQVAGVQAAAVVFVRR